MATSYNHQLFESPCRVYQPLSNDRCQNILYKAVFEHFIDIKDIAALLLTSKSFQNSSFGANFIANFVVDKDSILLLKSVLSPSSCFSMQFVPSLYIKRSTDDSEKTDESIANLVFELAHTKYLPLSLRSLRLDRATSKKLSHFFGSSSSNNNKSWPQLQDLALDSCDVDDTVLSNICKNTLQLRTVDLTGSWKVTDVGFERLSNFASITSLKLSHCYKLSDVGLEHITKLSHITSLNLRSCKMITDARLEHFSHLPKVNSVDLCRCTWITSVGLSHVLNLAGISSINLFGCTQVTDTDLENISKVACITSLNVGGCYEISDVGLEHLSKLSGITSLDLSACNKITDAGLEHIAKLPKIIHLGLIGPMYVTLEGRTKLKDALPNCKIVG